MAQDKAAEIIDFTVPRGTAAAIEGETTGAFLASARMTAGLAIEDISAATKVKVAHLQAIEDMRADLLPPLPYTIGFVKAYARHLGLDAEAVATRFREETAATAPAALDSARARELPAAGEGARLVSVFAIIAILIFGVWVMMQIVGGERGAGDSANRDPAPRVRLSDSPAAQPTPRPTRAIETDDEATAIQPPVMSGAGAKAAESETIGDAEGGSAAEEATPAAGEENRSATDETASAASETVEGENAAADETPVQNAEHAEPAIEEQPRALPRRAQPPRPAPVIAEAELIRSSAPVYPERCVGGAAAVESVSLTFDVSPGGRAANARVTSSTNDCFEAEAVRTISRWRFEPKTVNGTPAVDAGKSATLNFRR